MATINSFNNRVEDANVIFNGGTMSIGTDSTNNFINIGTAAAAGKLITIGNGIGTSTVVINSGTNDMLIGTNLVGHTIFIGNTVNPTQLNLSSGSGGLIFESANAGVTAFSSDGAFSVNGSSTVTLNGGGAINIATAVVTAAVNIATAGVRTLTIGSGTTTSSTVIATGTGGCSFGATANAHVTTVGSATSTSSTVIACGTSGIQVGTSTNAHLSVLGGITGTSSTTVQSGTGALNILSTNGVMTINSGTAALNISNNASATAVNIGTGAGVKTVILGSINTTSSTTINTGTAGLFAVGVFGTTVAVSGIPVQVDNANRLGTIVSSLRFKENIQDLQKSHVLLLRPVSFNYKQDKSAAIGLIAEEVEKIIPELVAYDTQGLPIAVRYHDLPVLLLLEIQKIRKELDELKRRRN